MHPEISSSLSEGEMVAPQIEWDNIDPFAYDPEAFLTRWLTYESLLQSRGYTLSHLGSDVYCKSFSDMSHIPIKAPKDPFHPRLDEAFWYIAPGVPPLKEPCFAGSLLVPRPKAHPALDVRGRRVILKVMRSSSGELAIIRLLSSYPLRSDPSNHTIPVIEILDLGEWVIVVTPEWGFRNWLPCVSAPEYLEYARQLFEGLAFMHENRIFHGDIYDSNVVMNHQGQRPGVEGLWTPLQRDFGPCGAKYAFIDFGESKYVHPGDELRFPFTMNFHSGTAAPELLLKQPVDVFPCDVYALGALLRTHVESNELRFLNDPKNFISIASAAPQYIQFLDAVMRDDPRERPTASEALNLLENLYI